MQRLFNSANMFQHLKFYKNSQKFYKQESPITFQQNILNNYQPKYNKYHQRFLDSAISMDTEFSDSILISTYYYNQTFRDLANAHYQPFCEAVTYINRFRDSLFIADYNEDTLFNQKIMTCFDHFMCSFDDQIVLKGRCPVYVDPYWFFCFYPSKPDDVIVSTNSQKNKLEKNYLDLNKKEATSYLSNLDQPINYDYTQMSEQAKWISSKTNFIRGPLCPTSHMAFDEDLFFNLLNHMKDDPNVTETKWYNTLINMPPILDIYNTKLKSFTRYQCTEYKKYENKTATYKFYWSFLDENGNRRKFYDDRGKLDLKECIDIHDLVCRGTDAIEVNEQNKNYRTVILFTVGGLFS